MFSGFLTLMGLITALHNPQTSQTCIVPETRGNAAATCRTAASQAKQGSEYQTTLSMTCTGQSSGSLQSVFEYRGTRAGMTLTWIDENNLRVEYSPRAVILKALPTFGSADHHVALTYVPSDNVPLQACDFELNNVLNIAVAS